MEPFSALLALTAGKSPVPVNSPHKGNWRGAFDVFFDMRLNKRWSKQPWGWLFETPPWSLWRQCNVQTNLCSHWLKACEISFLDSFQTSHRSLTTSLEAGVSMLLVNLCHSHARSVSISIFGLRDCRCPSPVLTPIFLMRWIVRMGPKQCTPLL